MKGKKGSGHIGKKNPKKWENEMLDKNKIFKYLTSGLWLFSYFSHSLIIQGILARMCAGSLMYPLDTVKARLQYNGTPGKGIYRSGYQTFINVMRHEGPLALYSGLVIKLLYTIPSAAISFTIYEQVKSLLSQMFERRKLKGIRLLTVSCLAGCGLRVFGTFVRTPFDVLRLRMQVESGHATFQDRRLLKKVQYSLKHRDFFRGYGITLLRDVPFAAMYFTTYEFTKRLLRKSDASKYKYRLVGKDVAHLASGAVAAVVGTTCTIPFDVVKTRLQTSQEYSGIASTFSRIYREEGLRAFSKGLGMRIVYLIPTSALTFAFYERFKSYFMDRKKDEKF